MEKYIDSGQFTLLCRHCVEKYIDSVVSLPVEVH